MSKLDFKTTRYFPGTFIFLGVLLAIGGLIALTKTIALGLVLLLAAAFLFTTTYGITIDLSQKKYHDYLWMLGFKKGEWRSFENIEYFFIKQRKASQKMNTMYISSIAHNIIYDGYLRFSEDNKVFIATFEDKAKLIAKLKPLADQLGVDVIDYATS
ncbi:MAG: hypothetical protein RIC80_06600 [Cyclobacteriaceae bacterium]